MKYLDEYRDGAAAEPLAAAIAPRGDAAVDDHGGVRRADAHHRQATASTSCCRRASSWSTAPAARCASRRWR